MLHRLPSLFTLIATLLAAPFLAAQDATIIKQARKENPTLRITSYEGSAAMQEQLKSNLLYSDWFTVTEAEDADYLLEAKGEAGPPPALQLILTTADGKTVSKRRAIGSGDAWEWLVHRAVDQLITDAFDTPGPCASRIAYSRSDGENQEIWLSNFDGGNPTQMTFNNTLSVEPAWGPNGRYLLYTLYERVRTSIVLVDLQAKRHRRLSASRGLNAGASFAPDGTHVAMTLSRDKVVDLYVQNLQTNASVRLTHGTSVEASPTWSPDSKNICYVTDEHSRRPTLYLIPATGGRPQPLLSTPIEAVSPDWSSVSNRIVFAIRAGREYTIAMVDMNAEGRRVPQELVRMAGSWEAPSWMADGRHIVCSRDYNGRKQLYMVDSWYGTVRPLKSQPGDSLLPAASPRL